MPKSSKSSKSKKGDQAFAVASMRPEDLVQGGLKGQEPFKAVIKSAQAVVFDFNGQAAEYGCMCAVEIVTVDDDGDEFTDYLFVGDLRYVVPSEDGETPAGGFDTDDYARLAREWNEETRQKDPPKDIPTEEDLERMRGDHILIVQGRGLMAKQPYSFFLQTLGEAGYEDWDLGIPGLVGLYGEWARHVPDWENKRGSGIINDGDEAKKRAPRDVLVLVEIEERREVEEGGTSKKSAKGKASKTSGAGTSKKASKAAETEEPEDDDAEDGELDEFEMEVQMAIVEAVGDGSLTKQKAVAAAFAAFKGDSDKKKKALASKLAGDDSFYERTDMLVYDPEENEITLAE